MGLNLAAQKMILEVGGEAMLKRALAATEKADVDTKRLESAGVAWKSVSRANVDKTAGWSLVEKMVGESAVQSTARWNGKTLIGELYGGK